MLFNHVPPPIVFPKLKQITTDNGRYYIDADGNKYFSVTTFLGEKDKDFFVRWNKANPGQSQIAKDRGSEVHHVVEMYLNNIPIEEIDFSCQTKNEVSSKRNRKTFDTLLPALSQISDIVVQEQRLFSKLLQLAGTADCIGKFRGIKSIIDFKTSKKSKDVMYVGDYFLQAACYAIMWEELTGEKINQIVIALANDDGTLDVHVQKVKPHLKQLVRRLKEYHAINKNVIV